MASTATTAPMAGSAATAKNYIYVISVLGILFFTFGFVTWLNGTLIPFLKLVCQLKGDVQPFLVTFAFYMAYFFLAIPSSMILKKTGYKKVGIDVTVFQVRVSYDQKPYRRALMETYGARCIASPSTETNAGRAILAKNPEHPGSLGIAISEAVEVAATHDDTKYALGSVLNHVLMHQTIIGQEAMLQLEMAGDDPRRDRRLHGRRFQLRRHLLPLHRPAIARQGQDQAAPHRGGGAGGLPLTHARQIRL